MMLKQAHFSEGAAQASEATSLLCTSSREANGMLLPRKSANLPKLVPSVDTVKTWHSKRKGEIQTFIEGEIMFLKSEAKVFKER